jgi:hypothetical protein
MHTGLGFLQDLDDAWETVIATRDRRNRAPARDEDVKSDRRFSKVPDEG